MRTTNKNNKSEICSAMLKRIPPFSCNGYKLFDVVSNETGAIEMKIVGVPLRVVPLTQ